MFKDLLDEVRRDFNGMTVVFLVLFGLFGAGIIVACDRQMIADREARVGPNVGGL